jgi:16S rRNA G966 N2-methylase RsmD
MKKTVILCDFDLDGAGCCLVAKWSSPNQQYDIIFAGPPYALNTIDELPKIIVEKKLISPNGYFILEHTPRNDYKTYEGYSFQRNYGATIFSFFECL